MQQLGYRFGKVLPMQRAGDTAAAAAHLPSEDGTPARPGSKSRSLCVGISCTSAHGAHLVHSSECGSAQRAGEVAIIRIDDRAAPSRTVPFALDACEGLQPQLGYDRARKAPRSHSGGAAIHHLPSTTMVGDERSGPLSQPGQGTHTHDTLLSGPNRIDRRIIVLL
jgi:hypothetical protein